MSDPIRINVRDHTGARTLEATAPPETSVKELAEALRARFGFPRGIPFRLFHREGNLLLPPDSTLMSIGSDSTLVLVPTREST